MILKLWGVCAETSQKARGTPGIKNVPIIYCREWNYITPRDVTTVCLWEVKQLRGWAEISEQPMFMDTPTVEPKPSPPVDLPVPDTPAQRSAIQGNWTGHNAHNKQDKCSKDTGNTSSLIWVTFSIKKSVGSQRLCYNSVYFKIKGIRVSFHLFLMSIFIRVHQLQNILFFPCPIPLNLPQHPNA